MELDILWSLIMNYFLKRNNPRQVYNAAVGVQEWQKILTHSDLKAIQVFRLEYFEGVGKSQKNDTALSIVLVP